MPWPRQLPVSLHVCFLIVTVLASEPLRRLDGCAVPGGKLDFVAYSADGRRIVSTEYDFDICVWDASTLQVLHVVDAFSHTDEELQATWHGFLQRMGPDTDAELPRPHLVHAALSSDGSLLVIGCLDTIQLWDIQDGRILWVQRQGDARGHTPTYQCASLATSISPSEECRQVLQTLWVAISPDASFVECGAG